MTETEWATCLKYLFSGPFQEGCPPLLWCVVSVKYFHYGGGPGQPSGLCLSGLQLEDHLCLLPRSWAWAPGVGGVGGWGGSRWRYSEESTKRDQRKLEQQLRTQSGLPNCLLDSSRRQPGVRCSGSLTSQQPLVFCAPEPVEDLI